ncbi:MAG TPA: hypothetical protein VGV38_02005, partial [Pyrinomonadaceae bacterium]|nr:hypothetical protein [Pyrinomonadaceae bacterium]
MDERRETKRDAEADEARPLERALEEGVRASKGEGEGRTWAGLAREFYRLPRETFVAASEVYAGLVGVSLKAGGEFVQAVPGAARVFSADELRAWGEMGRRLASADAETGAAFFASGTAALGDVPREARPLLFQICGRQMTLSTSVALETFAGAGAVARAVGDAELLRAVFEVALEISRRSAKHSADFLANTPAVAEAVRRVAREAETTGDESQSDEVNSSSVSQTAEAGERELLGAAVRLADAFASRAGGIAADMW